MPYVVAVAPPFVVSLSPFNRFAAYALPLLLTSVDGIVHAGAFNVHPLNAYPGLASGVGGTSAASYVQLDGTPLPLNVVPLLYHVVFIVFAL